MDKKQKEVIDFIISYLVFQNYLIKEYKAQDIEDMRNKAVSVNNLIIIILDKLLKAKVHDSDNFVNNLDKNISKRLNNKIDVSNREEYLKLILKLTKQFLKKKND
jgi:hypothetical protein